MEAGSELDVLQRREQTGAAVVDETDAAVIAAAVDRSLYHGEGDEVIHWVQALDLRRDRTTLGVWAAGDGRRDPPDLALELLIDRLAQVDDGSAAASSAWASVRVLCDHTSAALQDRVRGRLLLDDGALVRDGYRHDREGRLVVPRLEALSVRFAHLLTRYWGWPPGRALLARDEIDTLHYQCLAPELDRSEGPECRSRRGRERALQALPRRDLARGATVLALDTNRIILDWPMRLSREGGPYRAAALLEALPHWVEFLTVLRLIDGLPATRQAAAVERLGRLLAPSLRAETADPILTAAADRLIAARSTLS